MNVVAYYDAVDDAIADAVARSRDDDGATFWVTLQPSGWAATKARRCPDIRSVPLWRVRNGEATRLMEFPG